MSKQLKKILTIAPIVFVLALATGCSIPGQNVAGKVRPIDAADHNFGSVNAPVQMIVYSDFECPYCADFFYTVKAVEENFKDKVVIAFRHFPLPGHPEAMVAAEASECAAEQGKFWEMHDQLFADNVAGRMSINQFKKDGADLGLNTTQFNQCLDSNKYQEKINQQKTEGEQAGVTGTPTTFVNGNIYPGAYPFEDFTSPKGTTEAGMKTIINNLLK